MSKRKQAHDADADDDDDEQAPALVDVNFDYYDIDAGNDYHAIHRLLIQLFGPDAERVQTGPLAELIATVAEESGVGSTIKTEEEEGADPYAFLTVVGCHDRPGLQSLVEYLLSKTGGDEAFHATLSLLLQDRARHHVGLVLGERLVNMPVQVMPPMYRMLSEEMEEAIRDGRPYRFTHYLLVSRAYRLSAEEEEAMLAAQRGPKRPRAAETRPRTDGVYAFHPEDEEIMLHATHTATYAFTDAPPRDAEGVGLDLRGRAMLVPAERLGALLARMEELYAP